MKRIDEDKGMERSEVFRGMIVNLIDTDKYYVGDEMKNKLFITDRWLRTVYNMAYGHFWEKKKWGKEMYEKE